MLPVVMPFADKDAVSLEPEIRHVQAGDVEFAILEIGSGPLALCLHGFPDTAHTWRHVLPDLAAAGFHAVAPFMRGYAPTAVPEDGCYSLGALAHDANMLHDALDGDDRSVLIGHDWGAEAVYPAAAVAPERWRRLVTLSVPPAALDDILFRDYDQLKNFFYLFALEEPWAEELVSAGGIDFLRRLWADWSPGYDAAEDLAHVAEALPDPAHLSAAIGYYRATRANGECSAYAAEDGAVLRTPPQPTLYLHGERDGCIRVELVGNVLEHLSSGSRLHVVADGGHFLQLEQPRLVSDLIVSWIAP
jgi:pimeloyl-ACP methyl ester carboxylesterase